MAQCLVQRLEGNALRHETQIQHTQLQAFAQARPTIDCETRLRRNEHFELRFCPVQQPRRRGLVALVHNVREVEDFDQAGQGSRLSAH